MNVLSLFDGISCGQLALQRAGITYDNYYASEIDKHAIKITQKNFPNTIQLGDINLWQTWKLPQIDLLIGGSPCQGFSISGKGLNFDDPRSKLFFTFVNILRSQKPKYFLLENVCMKKEWEEKISEIMGCAPIKINSSLVSAQSRPRLYWTNIPFCKQIEDKNINLRDILDEESLKDMYLSQNRVQYFPEIRGRTIKIVGFVGKKEHQNNRIHIPESKSRCLCSATKELFVETRAGKVRRLSINEAEKLQTLPVDYTEGVANCHRWHGIGNGWTVDVVKHIFEGLKNVSI